jgi:hypothetical protein
MTYKNPFFLNYWKQSTYYNVPAWNMVPQSVKCILCGEKSFESGANMVQYVKSGYYMGCRGQDKVWKQIYEFAQRQHKMQLPLLTNGGGHHGVPEC